MDSPNNEPDRESLSKLKRIEDLAEDASNNSRLYFNLAAVCCLLIGVGIIMFMIAVNQAPVILKEVSQTPLTMDLLYIIVILLTIVASGNMPEKSEFVVYNAVRAFFSAGVIIKSLVYGIT